MEPLGGSIIGMCVNLGRKAMRQLPDSASPIISFENVSFNHDGRELHGISFAAYAGRVTVLIGPRHFRQNNHSPNATGVGHPG